MGGKEFKELVESSGFQYSELLTNPMKVLLFFRDLADKLMISNITYIEFVNNLLLNVNHCNGNTINLPVHKLPGELQVKLFKMLVTSKASKMYQSGEFCFDLSIYEDYIVINIYGPNSDLTYMIFSGNKFCKVVTEL